MRGKKIIFIVLGVCAAVAIAIACINFIPEEVAEADSYPDRWEKDSNYAFISLDKTNNDYNKWAWRMVDVNTGIVYWVYANHNWGGGVSLQPYYDENKEIKQLSHDQIEALKAEHNFPKE